MNHKPGDPYWVTVVEHTGFTVMADSAFDEEDRALLTDFIAMHPMVGEEIPDTGGLRWTDWGDGNVVVYYFRDITVPAYLLALYSKGEVMDLSKDERRVMRMLVSEIDRAFGLDGVFKVAASSDGAA